MIEIDDKSKCNGCHACLNICPKKCIRMVQDAEGFLYPEIDKDICISCGQCSKVCPVINGKTKNPQSLQLGYAAYNTNKDIRMNSSSGGIFTLLAESVISKGGIVIGAAMSDDCKSVQHVVVESVDDLYKLRGSKYVQSTIGNTFQKAKDALNKGQIVLFTGTPCQIGGLYGYLGREYSNLYTQDLICHGVPSPLIWKKYIEYRENKSGFTAHKIFFRNKKNGWKKYSMVINFSNNSEYLSDLYSDTFMKGFLQNIYLRPSCYKCYFKTIQRQSDITLADYWGVKKTNPEMDDDKGTSFVWIHSEKGRDLFNSLLKKMKSEDTDCNIAIRNNPAAIESCSMFRKRKEFFQEIEKSDFDSIIKKYTKISLYKRIHRMLGKIKRKIMH